MGRHNDQEFLFDARVFFSLGVLLQTTGDILPNFPLEILNLNYCMHGLVIARFRKQRVPASNEAFLENCSCQLQLRFVH